MDVRASSISAKVYWLLATRALSALGSSMTAFTINVWVFERSRSYALFAVLTLLTTIPNLLLAPIVGMVVDRNNKKYLLVACEAATAITVSLALTAFLRGAFGVLQAGLVVLVLGLASGFRWTLMGATIGSLVPRRLLHQVNGIQQSFEGAVDIGAPLLGAVMLLAVGPGWVFAADIISSLAAVTVLWSLDGRMLAPNSRGSMDEGLVSNALYGVRWIMRNPQLRGLLLFITFYNLAGGVYSVSFIPHFLSIANKESLGIALSLEGLGALFGGLLIAKLTALKVQPERVVYVCSGIFGGVMTTWGFVGSVAGAFGVAISSGVVVSALIASLQTTWQVSVPSQIQGQVFAARRMISYSLIPLATLLSIPFATHVTTPILASFPGLQSIWGGGESGGLGMLLSLLGAALVPVSAMAAFRSVTTSAVSASDCLSETTVK